MDLLQGAVSSRVPLAAALPLLSMRLRAESLAGPAEGWREMSPFRNPRPAPVTCRTPLCSGLAVAGEKVVRWCVPCAARLAKVREALEFESANMHARGPSASERRNTRRISTLTCCASGCYEPRPRGQNFCPSHRDIEQDEDSFA